MAQSDNAHLYKSLLSSPLGEDMLKQLNVLHDSLITEAESAEDPNTAFGLLKQAAGVIKAIGHLKFLSVVPKDEGNKGF